MKIKRWHSTLLALTGIAIGIFLSVSASALYINVSQTPDKVFEKAISIPRGPDPVQILEIKAAGKAVKIGERFDASEDWLKGTTFELQSNSDKEIVHIEFELEFPETVSSGNIMIFPIWLGHRPGINNEKRKPLSLKPGEKSTITIDDSTYFSLVKFLGNRHHISSINKAVPTIHFVIFDDNTGWGGGEYYRQDSDDPRRYVNIGNKPPSN